MVKEGKQPDAVELNALGITYLKGQGVKRDYELARKWYDIARATGREDS